MGWLELALALAPTIASLIWGARERKITEAVVTGIEAGKEAYQDVDPDGVPTGGKIDLNKPATVREVRSKMGDSARKRVRRIRRRLHSR